MESRIRLALDRVVATAKEVFGEGLRSFVLYGSGAEDALRPTSDVNVILVLTAFDGDKAARMREAVVLAGAAIRMRAMFLLESEVRDAAEAFAVKFEDVQRRHRVLAGVDPFAHLHVPREAVLRRLKQVLLNLVLRLREQVVTLGDDDNALARVAAESAGPLRACAAEILKLEGQEVRPPRESLVAVAGESLDDLSAARETGELPPGAGAPLVLKLMSIADRMRARVARLP